MQKRYSYFFTVIITLAVIAILFMKVFLANKGLVIDDEAWFLYLMRELPSGDAPTQFHKLFSNVFQGDIYSIRISYLVFELVSYTIFSIGLYSFFKDKYLLKPLHLYCFFALTLIGASIFSLPICNIPYYANLNKTLVPFSMGLLLFTFYKKSHNKHFYTYLFLSGFIIGFQAFIMITTVSIYLFFFILIYLYLKHQYISSILTFCGGILTSIAIYFLFIETPIHFWEQEILVNFKSYAGSDYKEKHGILPIIRWCFITLKYLIFYCLFPALAVIGGLKLLPLLNRLQKRIFYILLIITGLLYFYFEIIKGEHEYASINIFISALLFVIIHSFVIHKNQINNYPIFIILLIFPFMLSIGTDVDFKIRATDYIGTYFPLIYILGLHLKPKKQLIFSVVLLCYLINYSSMYYRGNWGYFRYVDQKHSVKKLGVNQNLLLDNLQYNNIQELQNYISMNETVIVSNKNLNGTCYLLNLKLLSYDFKLHPNKIIEKLNNNKQLKKIKLIETSYSPFESGFITEIIDNTNYKLIDTNTVGIHTIYTLNKNN